MGSCEMHAIVFVLIFLSNNTVQCTSRSAFPHKTIEGKINVISDLVDIPKTLPLL